MADGGMEAVYGAFKTYLLHVDAVTGAAEDEAGFHGFGEATGLFWRSKPVRSRT